MKYFSRRSGWLLFVAIFAGALTWVMKHPDDRMAARMHSNMMAMATGAFQEAIIFAHMKYHVSRPSRGAHLDLLKIDEVLVDFNEHGFPLGIEHDENSIKLPIRQRDCRQLWETLLAPMRPLLSPDDNALLHTEAIAGECVFTSVKFFNQKIVYDPIKGRVSLLVN